MTTEKIQEIAKGIYVNDDEKKAFELGYISGKIAGLNEARGIYDTIFDTPSQEALSKYQKELQ